MDREHRRDVTAGRSLTVDPPARGLVGWEIGASTCGPGTSVLGRSDSQDTRVKGRAPLVRGPAAGAGPARVRAHHKVGPTPEQEVKREP